MDKIKLFSKQKDHLPKQTIDNGFNYVGSSYDYHNDNTKHKYVNDNVGLTIDKFGLQIVTNPTNYLKENNIIQINRSELGEFKEKFEGAIVKRMDSNDKDLTPIGDASNAYALLLHGAEII